MKNKSNIFAKSTIILLVFILFFSALTAFTESATLNEVTSGTGNATGDRFGWNVSYAGDLNGDGYDDIIVGAPYVAAGGTERGAVYIFFGYSGINTSNINAANANVTISGATNNAHFGWSLGHGKVNEATGGIDDIIIGEPDNGNGKAYIFFGRSSWLSTYTTANANVILTVGAAGDKFGSSVSGAGDVNNDGYDDVIIGAYANSSSRGKAYIYYGGVVGAPTDSTVYVSSNATTYGTIDNFANAQSATDGGAYATLTEGLISGITIFNETFPTTASPWTGTGQDESWSVVSCTYLQVSDAGFAATNSPSGAPWARWNDADNGFASPENAEIFYANIDLSGYTNVQIEYYWQTDDVDTGEGLRSAYSTTSTNGVDGTWILMYEHLNPTDDVWTKDGPYSLPDSACVANFKLRFSAKFDAAPTENVGIDDVKITGSSYKMDIEFNTTNVVAAVNYYLQLNYNVSSDENFDVFVYNGATWDDMGDLTSTTMTVLQITLNSNHRLGSGYVRVRFVGKKEVGDGTRSTPYIEYHRIRSYGTVGVPFIAANITLTGENANDKFGFSVSGAGNVDGDSYDDVIVGAPGYDNNRGRAYVVYGGSSLASNYGVETIIFSENFEGDGSPTYAELGWTMEQYGSADSGNAFNWKLVKGADIKLTNHGSWQNECGSDASGVTIDTGLSSPVINCAGYNKVVVEFWSSYKDYTDKTEYGAVNISIDGGTSWAYSILLYESDGTTSTTTETRTVDISSYAAGQSNVKLRWRYKGTYDYYWDIDDVYVNGTAEPDVTLTGGSANDNFGYSVSGLGDINGDGVDDFAVGAPGYDNSKGRAYVYYGSNNLLSCVLIIQQQNDVKDACIFSDSATTNTGSLSEFYVGYCTDAGYLKERALIQFDLGNIPTDANIVKANMKLYLRNSGGIDTTFQIPAYRVTPPDTNEWTESGITWNTYDGTNNWETAGLGSGTDYVSTPVASTSVDTAVTWYTWDIKQVMQGWVDEIYPNRGLVLLNTTIEGNAANDDKWFFSSEYTDYYYRPKLEIEYVYANVTLTGAQTGDKFGYSVSGGNITRDSYNDIVIGAPYNDTAGSNAGAIYIFNGSASMPNSISALDANYTNYGENPNDNFGFSVSYAGDVNNDNYDDIIAGAPGYEINRGKVYVFTVVVLINNPPEITNLGVQGYIYGQSGLGNITNHTPKLNWTYSDPNGDFQGGYNVTVLNVSSMIIMWYINATGTDKNVTYGNGGSAPLSLTDSFDYNFTLKVNDSKGAWSNLSYLVFHMNSIPPIPDPKEPSNNSVQTEAPTITVSWGPVKDAEGISIMYWCDVYKPCYPNWENGTKGWITDTFFEFSILLGTYEWHVQANDSYENSSWSETWNFTVVSGNVAPTCDNPAVDGFYADTSKILNITSDNPLFNFTYNDNNGDNMYRRNFTVYTSSWTLIWYNNTTESVTPGYDVNVTYAGPALVDGQDYYLNVTCNDTNTTSLWSNVVSVKFHMNTKPTTTNVAPTHGSSQSPGTQAIEWSGSDPEPCSSLTYYWYVSEDDNAFTVLHDFGSTSATSATFTTTSGHTYYWRVRANDSYEYGDNSTTWSFTTSAGNDPPYPPGLIEPENNTWTNDNTPLFNWTHSDPNSDESRGYNVTISNSSDFSTINYWVNTSTATNITEHTWGSGGESSSPIADGTWYWRVKANDTSGAWGGWSGWNIIKIDTQKPNVTISTPTPGWYKGSIELNTTIIDSDSGLDISTIKYRIDAGSWIVLPSAGGGGDYYTIIIDTTILSGGPHTIYVIANDSAGNSNNTESITINVDNTPPSISSLNPQEGSLIRNKTVNISAVINDALSGINWSNSTVIMKIDGEEFNLSKLGNNTATGAIWKGFTFSTDGDTHVVEVIVKDYANNTATKNWFFVVDSTPIAGDAITFSHYFGRVGQTITIYVDVYNNETNLDPVTWYVNITDEFGNIICNNSITINRNSTKTTTATYTIPPEADGETITFTVRIYDGSEIDSQTAEFKVASSFTGAAPVKSFDPSLSMIFIAAIFAALLSLKCKHKRRKQS